MKFARFFPAGVCVLSLFLPLPSALAEGYECVAEALQGKEDLSSVYQKISVTVDRGYLYPGIRVQRLLNFGYLPGLGRQFFEISSSGPDTGLLKPNYLGMDFTAPLKPPIRPLFAFLILDSGEYVQHLVIDAQGRRWISSFELEREFYSPNSVTVSFTVTESTFLNAFEKAKTMAVELKYADGETLIRKTFDITRPESTLWSALIAAVQKERNYSRNCRILEQEIEN